MKKHFLRNLLLMVVMLSIGMSFVSFAGGSWGQDGNGWFYSTDGGGYLSNGFCEINGEWYYFNTDGYMCTGWVQGGDGSWYFMSSSGAMLRNTTTPDGKYWLDANGVWDGKTLGASDTSSSSALERNTMKATIDGVEETFYLTSTGGTVGGYKTFTCYSVKADGTIGKQLYLIIDPDTEIGEDIKPSNRDAHFSLKYKKFYDGEQYSARLGKGTYNVNITAIEADCAHVEGTFSATAKMVGGSGSVSITNGAFNLYHGEKVDWVKALVPSRSSSGGYEGGSADYDTGSSSGSSSSQRNTDYPCPRCGGSGNCPVCHGAGYTYHEFLGKSSKDNCPYCNWGTCSRCNGSGCVSR